MQLSVPSSIQTQSAILLIVACSILSFITGTLTSNSNRQTWFALNFNTTRFKERNQSSFLRSRAKSPAVSSVGLSNLSCSTWQCRITHGKLPIGALSIRVRNVCVGSTLLEFLPSSQENAKSLRNSLIKCCNSSALQIDECSNFSECSIVCKGLALHDMNVSLANNTYISPPSPILRGRTFLLDTAIRERYHYGHAISKFVQLAFLNESFDRILMNRVGRLPGGEHHGYNEDNARNIFDLTVGNLGAPIVLTGRNQICVEDLWMVQDYEQMFFSTSAAQRWRSLIKSKFGLTYQKCPPGRAFLLERKEGTLRHIVNIGDVEKVAAEFNISRIERVSISSKNTTLEHARLFASFGLLISTHSSALKSLIFSNPNSVVIEVLGKFIPDSRRSPFELGMNFLDIHYMVSRNHGTNLTACGSSCKPPTKDVHAPHIVNISLLRSAFQQGLTLQRRACPQLVYYSS